MAARTSRGTTQHRALSVVFCCYFIHSIYWQPPFSAKWTTSTVWALLCLWKATVDYLLLNNKEHMVWVEQVGVPWINSNIHNLTKRDVMVWLHFNWNGNCTLRWNVWKKWCRPNANSHNSLVDFSPCLLFRGSHSVQHNYLRHLSTSCSFFVLRICQSIVLPELHIAYLQCYCITEKQSSSIFTNSQKIRYFDILIFLLSGLSFHLIISLLLAEMGFHSCDLGV